MSDRAVSLRRSSGVARLARGWSITVLAVLLAAGGHQIAHSTMHGATEIIPLELLVFSAALTAPVAMLLVGHHASTLATAVTTVVGQGIFHGLYSLPYTGTSASALTTGHDHHHHPGHHGVIETVVAVPHDHAAGSDIPMLLAHFVAAGLTTLVVTHGEASLLTLSDWVTLRPVRIMLTAPPVVTHAPRTTVLPGRLWLPHPMNVTTTRTSRGPPVLA